MVNHARARSDGVRERVAKTKVLIEREIDSNSGVYPYGRLCRAEFCRRASIHEVTMYGKAHRDTTRVEIDEWLERISKAMTTGADSVRKKVTAAADEWEAKYKELATRFHSVYAVEIGQRQTEIDRLKAEVDELRTENHRLLAESTQKRVVPIRSASKGTKK